MYLLMANFYLLIAARNLHFSEPDDMMKSKGALKAFDRVKSCLQVNAEGEATYMNEGTDHKMQSSGGSIKVASLRGVAIQ